MYAAAFPDFMVQANDTATNTEAAKVLLQAAAAGYVIRDQEFLPVLRMRTSGKAKMVIRDVAVKSVGQPPCKPSSHVTRHF